jgi:hypothetical protein
MGESRMRMEVTGKEGEEMVDVVDITGGDWGPSQ